ncbi:Rieske 2Fe-2S domain-containing protein [Streptomyces racemochromogenes]|uniref:cholesterol 7-desaturase n=1 Tax=Streptomyces racemochromogenes TaxID=67353 RepID=A0ABW7PEG9_9ACTN
MALSHWRLVRHLRRAVRRSDDSGTRLLHYYDEHPEKVPLPYPSGWFVIAWSDELKPGQVTTRRLCGEDVVLYRTRGGTLHAVAPYCPHLGTHLGSGATVCDEQIVCPFHRYRFGPDGTCIATPGGPPPPSMGSLRHYPLREQDGTVYLWYSHDNSPPGWELPPPVTGPQFCRPVHWTGDLRTHPQQTAENSVDYAHFSALHGFVEVTETAPVEFKGPTAHVHLRFSLRRFPVLGMLTAESGADLIGLGIILFKVEIPKVGIQGRGWALTTPVGPWRARIGLAFSCAATGFRWLPAPVRPLVTAPLTRLAARLFQLILKRDLSNDFPIWNHMRYQEPPRLTTYDGPIGRLRRWARQFYPPTGESEQRRGSDPADVNPPEQTPKGE